MAITLKRIAWDAGAWIALIQKEKILRAGGTTEDRYSLTRSVIELAEKSKVELVISGLCLAEVCKTSTAVVGSTDPIAGFFEHDYILLVPVDKQIGTYARKLVMSGHGLKPPDAIHLATAIVANVDEIHTFDKQDARP